MHPIRTWLLQPYPFEMRWRTGLKTGLWAGLFVTLFLFLFKPFGLKVSPGAELKHLAICGSFGVVTLIISVLIPLFCLLFPKIFEEERWVVWKEILFNLFFISIIGLGNLLLANALWRTPITGGTLLFWQGLTFSVGVFPTVIGAFLTQMKLQRKYTSEAATLHPHPIAHAEETLITLTGDNQNEQLTLNAHQIAYLAAQDNYVQVFYLENDAIKQKMLRTTMRKMEEALSKHPQFCRCHRTFMVNFDRVDHVSGNAQGYRLHLGGVEESIPVSRNLNETIRARLR